MFILILMLNGRKNGSESVEQTRFTDVSHPCPYSISSLCLLNQTPNQPSENKLSGKKIDFLLFPIQVSVTRSHVVIEFIAVVCPALR